MAGWNGSGVFTLPYNWVADAAAGIPITASRFDAQDGYVTLQGFGNTLTRDGQGYATANLPMGGFKHTGAAVATATGQYLVYQQLVGSGTLNLSAATLTLTGTLDASGVVALHAGLLVSSGITAVTGGLTVILGGANITGGGTIATGNLVVSAGTLTVSSGATIAAGGITVTSGPAVISSGSLVVAAGIAQVSGNTQTTGGAFIQSTGNVPASAAAAGVAGQMAWDATYEYRCVATNTWVRNAHTTW